MPQTLDTTEDGQDVRFCFGAITALPKEFAAMRAMLDHPRSFPINQDPNQYVVGTIPSVDGSGMHQIVVTLLKKPGNNTAAAAASHLVRSFPTVTDVLMVGIAGGIPNPENVDRHVRLGDIVISNECGVVQYDNGKLAQGKLEIRDTSQAPSAALVGKVKFLESERIAGHRPWESHINRATHLEASARPSSRSDQLFSVDDSTKRIPHPRRDPLRQPGQPKLHYGRIGSANTLLKDPKARDALSKAHDLRAIEMEGSGIADGTWMSGKSYILIRAISDYCDLHKNDVWQGFTDTWQGYAAVAAAAYARALIEAFPATGINIDFPETALLERRASGAGATTGFSASADPSSLHALDLLQKLLPAQFEEVFYLYGAPSAYLPPLPASQTERAIALLRYAHQYEGAKLRRLLSVINAVAPYLKSVNRLLGHWDDVS